MLCKQETYQDYISFFTDFENGLCMQSFGVDSYFCGLMILRHQNRELEPSYLLKGIWFSIGNNPS